MTSWQHELRLVLDYWHESGRRFGLLVNISIERVGGMSSSWRALFACLVCGVVSLVSWSTAAGADELVSGAASSSLSGNPLVLSGANLLLAGQQAAAEEARRASPEAVAEREASRTEYESLGGSGAVALAERDFGIASPSWVSPEARGAGRITKYVGEDSAVELLPDGKRLLVQSSVPLLSSVGSGQGAPTSFALKDRGDVYEPANPLVPVSVSKTPGDGVLLPLGVSVAPGQASAPEPSVVVGDRVVYPGTATDTDFMVEPVPGGVETSWQLRSEASPRDNALVLGLPSGAVLQMSSKIPGAAEVVEEDQTLFVIPRAVARQADGSLLSASYSISGDTLTTHVDLSGSIDFPVLVDPVIRAVYGGYEGSNLWTGWEWYTDCGCFGHSMWSNLLLANTNPGALDGAFGQWYISAPGAGLPGGAGITRVDITGLGHYTGLEESSVAADIGGTNGNNPVWTFNGYAGAMGSSPLNSFEPYANQAVAFCAQGAGGHDGGEQPLCDENYSGEDFAFEDIIGPEPQAYYSDAEISGAAVTYLDNTAPDEVVLEGMSAKWVKVGQATGVSVAADDQGVGIQAVSVEIPPGYAPEGKPFFVQEFGCSGSAGFDGCPHHNKSGSVNFSGLGTGAYTLGVYGYDATGNVREESPDPKLYIDKTAPKFSAFGGSLNEANGGTIGSGNYTLTFGAEDGSTGAPQSGVRSLLVYVDGSKATEISTSCSEPIGVPASGCFGLSGSWTMEGQKYGAGYHTITVKAFDWLGNEASESLHVTVNEAPYEAMGPGMVNARTGDYKLAATDVSAASAGASLTLSRAYDSRQPTQGSTGPLGPQWSLGLPDAAANGLWQGLKVLANGSVQATLTSGSTVVFSLSGSTYTSPPGYQTYVLTKTSSSPLEYSLADAASNATIFTRASSGEETEPVLVPSGIMQAMGAGGLNKVTYSFTKTSEGIVEPTKVLAPYPSTINCLKEHVEELVAGCRELTFNYAASTTAEGEGPTQWGDYKGRLTRVYFTAWNPATSLMATTTVAQYAYDTKGRLRAEWDPRISPELKTEYGYDAEGHVTSLTPPGQETWAFTYGTVAGDSNQGRLLKALQAPASIALWNGESPKNTEAPKLSGSVIVGQRMSVTDGVWSPAPVAYTYQWQDCNLVGEQCVAIVGATNPNYTPVSSDIGHMLVAQVSAVNGAGSVAASTEAKRVSAVEYSLPAGSDPAEIATGPDGKLWFVDWGTSKVGKITTAGAITEYSLPAGSGPLGITSGPDGNLWFTDASTSKIGKITTSGVVTEYALPSGSNPYAIVTGSDGNLWFTEFGTSKIGKITTSGAITEYSLPSGSGPYGIAAGPDNNLWFTEWGTSKIGKLTTAGVRSEYSLPPGSQPFRITAGPDGNLWFLDWGTNKVGKITTNTPTVTEYSLPSGSLPNMIAAGPDGNLWFTDRATNKIGKVTTSGVIAEYSVPSGSGPVGIAVGPDSNIWYTDTESGKIGKIILEEAPEYALPAGSEPFTIASGPDGKMWFTDKATNKLGKITTAGSITEYSTPAGSQPYGIAAGSDGNLWYTDFGTNKVGKSTTTGSLTEYTLPASSQPVGIVAGPDNNLWFADYGTSKISKITTGGTLTEYALPAGSGPFGITVGPDNNIWFTNVTSNKIGRITTSGSISEYALPAGSQPYMITAGADGNLWFAEFGTSKIGKITVSGTPITEYALPANSSPYGIAAGTDGNLWFTDWRSNKLGKITTTGTINEYGLPTGGHPYRMASGPDGNMWYTNVGTNSIGKMIIAQGEARTPQPGSTIEYNVPLSANNVPAMSKTEVEKWAQLDVPWEATAIFPPDEPQGWPASDYKRATIYYLDSANRTVNISSPTGGISTTEYDTHDNPTRELSAANRATAIKEAKPAEAAEHLGSTLSYNSEGTELTSTLGPEHKIKLPSGSEAQGRKQVTYKYDEGAPEGGPYRLVTSTKEAALVAGKEEDVRTVTKSYSGGSNLGWKLHQPTSTVTDPAGLKLTYNTTYSSATGAVLETQTPGGGTGNTGAHTSQIVYYTPLAEASVAACQNHPEWANLPCQTQPAHQPEAGGLPNLPVTTYTYNMWDEAEITKSTSGESTRTETQKYDSAGRLATKETTSNVGATLPAITYTYNSETGLLTKQSTGSGSGEQKITSVYNNIGQMTSYTDADGAVATYEYENGKDARLKTFNDGKGVQTYTYDEGKTGELTELTDTATGKINATYDPEGKLLTEKLPDGLTANVTYNAVNEATGLEYHKASNCGASCTWYNDTAIPSIHGQWITQNSSFATQNYTYDATGRLTQVQNTPAGKECTTRLYTYDPDGNRTAITSRPPNAEKKCGTEGGTTENHTYDTADRLMDAGIEYNAFGDIKTLSAVDAGGSKLTSKYYVNGQVENQEQAEQTVGYHDDPGRRIRETVSTGKVTATEIQNYPGPGQSPSWSSEPSGNWTRNIPGIGDSLDAIQHNGETPVLQLSNLHGDIVATAYDSETPTTLASTIGEANEYGIPATEAPPKYSWLGAHQIPTELPSGASMMGSRSYIPQLGRFLQPDPTPGGSANSYAYTHGNPINETDLSGAWSINQTSGGQSSIGTGEGTHLEGGTGIAAGAIMPAPVNTQIEAAFQANPPWDQYIAGDEEYEEYEEEWEEEGWEEYAAWHHETAAPFGEGLMLHAEGDQGELALQNIVPLCTPGSEGAPCGKRVAGGCPSTKDPCWKNVHGGHGKRNQGGTGPCRSGGSRKNGKCQAGKPGGTNGCAEVYGAAGGLAGAALGSAGGPLGSAAGGAVGGEAGAVAGNAICGR